MKNVIIIKSVNDNFLTEYLNVLNNQNDKNNYYVVYNSECFLPLPENQLIKISDDKMFSYHHREALMNIIDSINCAEVLVPFNYTMGLLGLRNIENLLFSIKIPSHYYFETGKKYLITEKTKYNKINMGTSDKILDEYLNIDIRKLKGIDVVSDIHKLSIRENSIKEIYISHVLEHFTKTEASDVLFNLNRILTEDGILKIGVPDMDGIIEAYTNKTINFPEMIYYTFGQQDYEFNIHKTGFNRDTLIKSLAGAGFNTFYAIKKTSWLTLFVIAGK